MTHRQTNRQKNTKNEIRDTLDFPGPMVGVVVKYFILFPQALIIIKLIQSILVWEMSVIYVIIIQ